MKMPCVTARDGFKPIFKSFPLSKPLKGENLKNRLNPSQVVTNSDF